MSDPLPLLFHLFPSPWISTLTIYFKNRKAAGSQTGADPHHSLHRLARGRRITRALLICRVLTLLRHRNHLFNPACVWLSSARRSAITQSLSPVLECQPSPLTRWAVFSSSPVFLFCLGALTVAINALIKMPRAPDAVFRSPPFPLLAAHSAQLVSSLLGSESRNPDRGSETFHSSPQRS